MNSLKSLYLALPALILFATTILSTCDNENLFKGAMTHRGSGLPIEQIAYNCESEYICTNSTKSVDYCGILTCNEDKWEGEHLCQKYNIRGPKTCPSLPTLKNGIYVGGGCFPNTWSRSVCTYICQNGFKAASIKDHQCQKEIGTIKCQNSIWEIPKCSLIPTSSSKDFFRPVTEENRASILLMSPDTSTCFYYIPELYSVRKIILENGEKAYSCNKGYFCNNPAVITTELSKFCGVFTCASGSWSLEVWCIHTCTEPFTLNPQLQPKSTEDSSTQSFLFIKIFYKLFLKAVALFQLTILSESTAIARMKEKTQTERSAVFRAHGATFQDTLQEF